MTIQLPENLHETKQTKRQVLLSRLKNLKGKNYRDLTNAEKDIVFAYVLYSLGFLDENGNLQKGD